MSYYTTPEQPFREALLAVVGKEPPAYVKGYGTEGLTDQQIMELQDWCSMNARPHWATGLSMMEAAELIVAGAVENANIEPDPQEEIRKAAKKAAEKAKKKAARKTAKKSPRKASSRGSRIDGSTRIGE